jgi:hypothetical protein
MPYTSVSYTPLSLFHDLLSYDNVLCVNLISGLPLLDYLLFCMISHPRVYNFSEKK